MRVLPFPPLAYAVADPRVHSNNMYLELASGGGVVVFAAFLWLMRAAARVAAAVGTAAIGAGLAAAMVTIALHGVVDSFLSFAPTYILFALTLGAATALTLDNGAHVRAREGAEWGDGAPRATEPGYGAEPHLRNAHRV